jgi:hypothetical protein
MDVLMQIKSLQGVKTTQTSSRSLEDRGDDAIELTIFRFTSRDLCNDATCTTHRRSFASFEAKLKNPSLTCFATKQAAGYRVCPHTVFIRSLVLRRKPTNLLSLGFDA